MENSQSSNALVDKSRPAQTKHGGNEIPRLLAAKKLSAALLAAACLCAPALPQVAAQGKAPAKAPEFLFVQTAKGIAYQDGVLILQDVSPATMFFLGSSKANCGSRPQRFVPEEMDRG
jgi:hypothetical protein